MNSETLISRGRIDRLVITGVGKEFMTPDGCRQRTFQGEAWFKIDGEEFMVPVKGVFEHNGSALRLKSLDFGLFYPKLSDFLRRQITSFIESMIQTSGGDIGQFFPKSSGQGK